MVDLATNTLAFLFAISVIIFVHELGHFAAAKAFGMRVLSFSLGFGRRVWGFRRGETEYRIGWMPLGGYVKLSGEEPGETIAEDDPSEFLNRPRWQRIVVYLAGPAMNGVLSVAVMWGLFVVGLDVPALQTIPSVVGEVQAGSPAAVAGIEPGDRIVAIDGRETDRWQDVMFAVATSVDRPIHLDLERAGERRAVDVTPIQPEGYDHGDVGLFPKILPKIGRVVEGSPAEAAGFRRGDEIRSVDDQPIASTGGFIAYVSERPGRPIAISLVRDGAPLELDVVPADEDGIGRIGVLLTIEQRFPPGEAFRQSLRFTYDLSAQTLAVIGKIFKREVAAKNVLGGPIEIAAQSGAAARSGFKNLLYLMAMVSVSIGLLNLFPIPILDGGQILILLVESAARRDLSLGVRERIAQVGLALVVLLMATVLWFDLSKNLFR